MGLFPDPAGYKKNMITLADLQTGDNSTLWFILLVLLIICALVWLVRNFR